MCAADAEESDVDGAIAPAAADQPPAAEVGGTGGRGPEAGGGQRSRCGDGGPANSRPTTVGCVVRLGSRLTTPYPKLYTMTLAEK